MPTRRRFIAAAAGLAAAPALTTRPAVAGGTPESRPGRPQDDRPNIVVVLADDLGFGHLGSYGQRLIRTPTLDELASQGTRFTQAYAAAAVCAPSRASLLTGLHSGHAAVRQNPFGGPQGSLGDDDTTFAEVLRARGYRTACIGKWGFGPDEAGQPSHPNWRGFEESHQYHPEYLWHNGEKVELPENADGRKGTYAIDLIQSRANDFVTENASEPFLLYLTPNVPRQSPAQPGSRSRSGAPVGGDPARHHGRHHPRPAPRTGVRPRPGSARPLRESENGDAPGPRSCPLAGPHSGPSTRSASRSRRPGTQVRRGSRGVGHSPIPDVQVVHGRLATRQGDSAAWPSPAGVA
ncbi:sulfatase-like hydrolase/transferase [Streptomyces sp. NPDC048301]|uniref:sulfatase-like hydrolase/transferase n=1 Tax=Streptomyces sp. NPDC048301 TaxID=3155631 RepID=UPI003434B706